MDKICKSRPPSEPARPRLHATRGRRIGNVERSARGTRPRFTAFIGIQAEPRSGRQLIRQLGSRITNGMRKKSPKIEFNHESPLNVSICLRNFIYTTIYASSDQGRSPPPAGEVQCGVNPIDTRPACTCRECSSAPSSRLHTDSANADSVPSSNKLDDRFSVLRAAFFSAFSWMRATAPTSQATTIFSSSALRVSTSRGPVGVADPFLS